MSQRVHILLAIISRYMTSMGIMHLLIIVIVSIYICRYC